MTTWETTIGLEIHAQLKTQSKMFSSDSTEYGSGDNENVSTVSLGLPGALPRVNKTAVEYSMKVGFALGSEIRQKSVFARKNYFYPDLPKGYQISQFDKPICEGGQISFFVEGEKKTVNIERAHMEEDAGKSTHHGDHTLINLNRAGIPLLEIVSKPEMHSGKEAAEYARTIRSVLRYLDVCDGNLEEGSLRCDCNVSVAPKGSKVLGQRVEIKNINSFRFVEKAIEYEAQRQINAIESGEKILQETRLWNTTKNQTFAMRSKEEANDYRYFPDPDILPVVVSDEWMEEVKNSLPELPLQKAARFQESYGLSEYDSSVLTADKSMSEYFEAVAKGSGHPKTSANWMMGELSKELNNANTSIDDSPVSAKQLASLVSLIEDKTISGKMGKNVFARMYKEGIDPEQIIKEEGLQQITDPAQIEALIQGIIDKSPNQVEQYRGGKNKLFGFFVGQAMKESKGQANPDLVNQALKKMLGPSGS